MLIEDEDETDPQVVETAVTQVLRAHHIQSDYAVVRHPLTLAAMESINPKLTGGVVALVAGRLGAVRLIDNMILGR